MKRFSEAIQSKILLFDGSMGALLSRMGHVTPCPDELAVTRPDGRTRSTAKSCAC